MAKHGRTFGAVRILNKRGVREPVATLGVWPTSEEDDPLCLVALARVHPSDVYDKAEGKRRVVARLSSAARLNRSELHRIFEFRRPDLNCEDDRLGLGLLLSSRVCLCRKSQLRTLRERLTGLLEDDEARFKILREFGLDTSR